jgi:hypothetical protein
MNSHTTVSFSRPPFLPIVFPSPLNGPPALPPLCLVASARHHFFPSRPQTPRAPLSPGVGVDGSDERGELRELRRGHFRRRGLGHLHFLRRGLLPGPLPR